MCSHVACTATRAFATEMPHLVDTMAIGVLLSPVQLRDPERIGCQCDSAMSTPSLLRMVRYVALATRPEQLLLVASVGGFVCEHPRDLADLRGWSHPGRCGRCWLAKKARSSCAKSFGSTSARKQLNRMFACVVIRALALCDRHYRPYAVCPR